jgi:hypothetical protein
MRIWDLRSTVAAAIVLGAAAAASAQDVPRMADGKPDFSGIYSPPATVNATGPRGNLIFNADKMAPVKPGAEGLLYEARNGDPRHDEPRAMCLPAGFPSGMLYILPIQIVQNPQHIVIVPELQRAARIIPTDGRPHREGIEPSYYGDSVGKWEGDTLVIDTVNLTDRTWLDDHGNRHSDALHVTERWRRVSATELSYQETIEDPKFYTKPWTVGWTIPLAPADWVIMEYACTDNNKDLEDGHLQPGPLDGSLRNGTAIGPPAPPRK